MAASLLKQGKKKIKNSGRTRTHTHTCIKLMFTMKKN